MNNVITEYAKIAAAVTTAIKPRAHAPHCDQRVLHRPGECWACDSYPDWQAARIAWGINFTGGENEQALPCPAEIERPLDVINRWHGNVAETAEEADRFREEFADALAEAFDALDTSHAPMWRGKPASVLARLSRWWSNRD